MGVESGINPAEAEAMKAHNKAEIERVQTIEAKYRGIKNNPGERRSWGHIMSQATKETDAGEIFEVPVAPSKESDASTLSLFEFIELDESDRDPSGRLTAEAKDRAEGKAVDLTPDLLIKLLIEAADRKGENWDVYAIAEYGLLHGDNHEILKDFPEVQEYLDVNQRLIELPIEYPEDEIADEVGKLREEQKELASNLTSSQFTNNLRRSVRAFIIANRQG
ncbi:MAG: hypothetical protein AAB839_00545 [Patescibacteria group bacterium]